jgi:outer membrane receptor protein involved in Fe transport
MTHPLRLFLNHRGFFLRSFGSIALCVGIVFSADLFSQQISSTQSLAPTQFQDEIDLEAGESSSLFRTQPLTDFRESGLGQLETFSFRGGRSADVGVFLEGIPLSSEALGPADVREAGLFGVGRLQLIRGSILPLASYPQGQVHLQLNESKKTRVSLGAGSFYWRQVGLESEKLFFRYEAAENNYFVREEDEPARTRQQDRSTREIQLRYIERFENWKLLYQLQSNRDETGPGFGVDSLSALLGASGVLPTKNLDWASWASFRQQDLFFDSTTNWSFRAGQRLSHRVILPRQQSLENSWEAKMDKLWHENFTSPTRATLSWTPGWVYTPAAGQVLQARLRGEWVSDLENPLSLHPQLGGRHSFFSNLNILWNLSQVSVAPDFYDLYYEEDSFFGNFIPNPNLKRERTRTVDLGHEWKLPELNLWLRQIGFFSYSQDLIQKGVETSPGSEEFQSQNADWARRYGVENQIHWSPTSDWGLQSSYRWMKTSSSRGPLLYVASHQASVAPEWSYENWKWSLPLWFRSRIYTQPEKASSIPPQVDLGMKLIWAKNFYQFEMNAYNLLRSKRRDDAFSSLPEESWFRFVMRASF